MFGSIEWVCVFSFYCTEIDTGCIPAATLVLIQHMFRSQQICSHSLLQMQSIGLHFLSMEYLTKYLRAASDRLWGFKLFHLRKYWLNYEQNRNFMLVIVHWLVTILLVIGHWLVTIMLVIGHWLVTILLVIGHWLVTISPGLVYYIY